MTHFHLDTLLYTRGSTRIYISGLTMNKQSFLIETSFVVFQTNLYYD